MRTMLPTVACADAVVKWGCVTLTGSLRSAAEPVPSTRAWSVVRSMVTVAGWFSLRPVTDGTTSYRAPQR